MEQLKKFNENHPAESMRRDGLEKMVLTGKEKNLNVFRDAKIEISVDEDMPYI